MIKLQVTPDELQLIKIAIKEKITRLDIRPKAGTFEDELSPVFKKERSEYENLLQKLEITVPGL